MSESLTWFHRPSGRVTIVPEKEHAMTEIVRIVYITLCSLAVVGLGLSLT